MFFFPFFNKQQQFIMRKDKLRYKIPTISKGYSRWIAFTVVYMLKRNRKLIAQNRNDSLHKEKENYIRKEMNKYN